MRAIGPCSQSTMLGVLVAAVAGLLLLLLLHGRWFPFLWADLGAFVALVGSSLRCRWRLSRRPPITLLQVFQSHARRRPHHPLLLFQDEVYTFSDMERRSNRAARAFALRLGLQPGQTVAVFLPNVPAYVWTWLALAKLGCAMACLNCNVRGRALLHARSAARADIVLSCSGELGGWGLPRVCVCVCRGGGLHSVVSVCGQAGICVLWDGSHCWCTFSTRGLTHTSACARVCMCQCLCTRVSVRAIAPVRLHGCQCLCVDLHTSIPVHVCMYVVVCACLCVAVSVDGCAHVSVHVCTGVSAWICMYVVLHAWGTRAHAQTYMYVSVPACLHISAHGFDVHACIYHACHHLCA